MIWTRKQLQTAAAQLTLFHNLNFTWIPGHNNITGNEVADKVARDATNCLETPTYDIPISWKSTKQNRRQRR